MARSNDKVVENVGTPYFVDGECIACDTCTDIAPENFKLTVDYDHAYVNQQPHTPQQIKNCEEAILCCPVDAIGNNG